MFKKLLLSITISFTSILLYAQDGSLDLSFDPGTGVYGAVRASDIQSDGKILIGGSFSTYNGIAINSIARINTDGSLDTSFDPGTGVGPTTSYPLWAICVRSDGKILIGGNFITYNGTTVNSFALLNADGSLDVTFNSGTGIDGAIYDIAIQSNGKILIGGTFSTYNGIARNSITRINTDGSLDLTFNSGSGVDGLIEDIAIQNDGKIIVGGWFTSYNGVSRKNITRLNSDGTIDLSFNPGTGANDRVESVAVQNDGKIYIGGRFTSYNGTSLNRITRLNQNGSHDPTFNIGTGVDNLLKNIIPYNGKILLTGSFDFYNGISRNGIVRVNTDGTNDLTFDPGTGADSDITCSNIQSDGKIFIGGYFITYNGTSRSRVARINSCNPVSQPSAISGSTYLCNGATETYSVTNDPNATSYTWALPSGWSGTSTTNTITATTGASGGAITVVANNACGISSVQTLSIIIEDVTAPVADITTLSDITSQCSVTSLTAPTATDNCAGTITGTHNATLPITTPGTTTVTWTYDDGNGNTSTQIQNVVIDDVTAPVANTITLANITSECSVTSLIAPTATDNCAGSITGTHNATFPITTQGTTTITWTYNDGNGNTSTQTQSVIIDDVTAPVANTTTLANVTSECSVTSLIAPTATDNCAGSITGTHNATLPITTPGTTTVTWTYDDGNGNSSTQTQSVVITPINNGVTQTGALTLSANAAGYDYQWVDCNNGNQAINSETGQTFTATANGSYAVMIDNGSCTVTSNCTVINSVGIESLDQNDFKVFPNPTSGVFTINSTEILNNVIVEIYSSIGQLVYQNTHSGENILVDLSKEAYGIYQLTIRTGDKIIVHKIVKN